MGKYVKPTTIKWGGVVNKLKKALCFKPFEEVAA